MAIPGWELGFNSEKLAKALPNDNFYWRETDISTIN